jgi:hypothetical protein
MRSDFSRRKFLACASAAGALGFAKGVAPGIQFGYTAMTWAKEEKHMSRKFLEDKIGVKFPPVS